MGDLLTRLGWWLVLRFGGTDIRFADDLEIVYGEKPQANFTWTPGSTDA